MTEPKHVHNNTDRSRFEIALDGEFAYLDYRYHEGRLALMHTFVPPEHEGHGYAGQLAKFVLDFARKEGLEVLVYCPYVSTYIERHPEYSDLVHSRS